MANALILAGDTVTVRSLTMSLQVEGFETTRVPNGDTLIQRYATDSPAVVLCDLSAPWSALSSLLRRLRAHNSGRSYCLALFGERPVEANDAMLQRLGISEDDIFPEPIDIPALVKRIRSVQSKGPVAAKKESGDGGFPHKATFDKIPAARVFTLLVGGKATGQLEITQDGGPVTISIREGALLQVEAATGPLALSEWLVHQGQLNADQLKVLSSYPSLTIELLVSKGLVSPHEILSVGRGHAEFVIREVVRKRTGGYRWLEGSLPDKAGFNLDVKLFRQILDAYKAEPGDVSDALFEYCPCLTSSDRENLQGWDLRPFELRATNQLNGTRSIRTVVESLSGGNDEKKRQLRGLMAAMLDTGIFKLPDAVEAEVDWSARLEEYRSELDRMKKSANPFELLGVTDKTSSADIRAKFFQLSKQYHPDRAFDAPAEARTVMEEVFRLVQEAYEIAGDPKRREEYFAQKEAEKDGLNVRNAIQAEIEFSQGELFLKNRNYPKAKEFFEKALALNGHAVEYKAFLGWTTYLTDTNAFEESARLIHEAIKANPKLDRGYYFLGCIFKARNEQSQAENAFKKAVAINAGNVEAQRELRLASMRKEKASSSLASSIKKGLFGRFKK